MKFKYQFPLIAIAMLLNVAWSIADAVYGAALLSSIVVAFALFFWGIAYESDR